MSSSWTPPVDLTNWWICCVETCKREVNPTVWGEICPDCNHPKCDTCQKISRPAPPTQQRLDEDDAYEYSQLVAHYAQNNIEYAHSTCMMQQAHPQHEVQFAIPGNIVDYTEQGDMSGWWKCCQDQREVNSAWYENTCPDCGHVKCDYCTDY